MYKTHDTIKIKNKKQATINDNNFREQTYKCTKLNT